MEKRVFINPKVKDKVTLLETSKETGGTHTLLEVELAPGGGTPPHYHGSFIEEFTAVEGVLGVMLHKRDLLLNPGQQATVERHALHRFFNPGRETIRFHVRIVPGSERFENSLKIGYGLAVDGFVNNKGVPNKLDHISLLLELSDTRLPGFLSFIQPYLKRRAKSARKRGVDTELFAKYC
jgi:quercetin dioxygenase-like cupin family protein